ncbi:MAG: hypothetical protein K8F91_10100, partial [Candidatus Obscuribacterales bacterium]|nr:hypothetical protein [Candidatus Obscuribacterales bacterium]
LSTRISEQTKLQHKIMLTKKTFDRLAFNSTYYIWPEKNQIRIADIAIRKAEIKQYVIRSSSYLILPAVPEELGKELGKELGICTITTGSVIHEALLLMTENSTENNFQSHSCNSLTKILTPGIARLEAAVVAARRIQIRLMRLQIIARISTLTYILLVYIARSRSNVRSDKIFDDAFRSKL